MCRMDATKKLEKCVATSGRGECEFVDGARKTAGDYRTDVATALTLSVFGSAATWLDLYDSLFDELLRQVAAVGRLTVLIYGGAAELVRRIVLV